MQLLNADQTQLMLIHKPRKPCVLRKKNIHLTVFDTIWYERYLEIITSVQFNVDVTEHLAKISKDMNIFMIYISTDYVFDGKNPPYQENATRNPLNLYGMLYLLACSQLVSTL